MAPKATFRSRQPSKASKEKEEVREQSPPEEVEEEEEGEDPEEDGEDDELRNSTENPNRLPKSGLRHLNGFVSDSGSESDSDDSNSGYKVQPIPKPAVTNNAPISSPAKRTHRDTSDVQRSKKPKPDHSGKKSSSGAASRIWNKDDEIIVLSEMADFKKSKGVDLNLELVAFYDSIKGKLHGEYSKEQLRTKIKHMRKKYLNVMMKCMNGSDPDFSNSHEALIFDLSKKAWGAGKGKNVNGTNNGVHENVANENSIDGKKDMKERKDNAEVENDVMVDEKVEREGNIFLCNYPFLRSSIDESLKHFQSLGLSEAAIKLMNGNLDLIGKENARELDDEWKELLMEEMELNHKRASLAKKQIKLVFNRINKYNVG